MKMEFDLTEELSPGIYEVELEQYKSRQWLNPDTEEAIDYLDFEFYPVGEEQIESIQYSCPKQPRGSRSKLARLVKSLLPGKMGKINLDDLLNRRMKAEVDLNERGYLAITRHWPLETPQTPQSGGVPSLDRSSGSNKSS